MIQWPFAHPMLFTLLVALAILGIVEVAYAIAKAIRGPDDY